MNRILERIGEIGIVPVVVLKDAKDALPLADALCRGGLPCAEVTFRTEAAEEAILAMTEAFPDMLVGAGTVLNAGQADRAASAGAEFIVSPGFNPHTVMHCVEKGMLIVPGCMTPGDVEQALECGLEAVKFFPAEAAGGLKMIKALAAPYGSLKFMPTGGINQSNVRDYMACGSVLACGGSWMVKSELVEAQKFDEIAKLARECVEIVRESRGK